MKKIYLVFIFIPILFLFLPVFCYSQSFDSRVTAWRGFNYTNVTSKTSPHSITPLNVGGGIGDSLGAYLIQLHDSLIGLIVGSGSLQAAINVSNVVNNLSFGNNSFSLSNTLVSLDSVIYSSDGIQGFLYGTGLCYMWLTIYGSGGALQLKDISSANNFTLRGNGLTGNRVGLFPDEPTATGAGLASEIMLHTSRFPWTYSASGITGHYGDYMQVSDVVGNSSIAQSTQMGVSSLSGGVGNETSINDISLQNNYTNGAFGDQQFNLYFPLPNPTSFVTYGDTLPKRTGGQTLQLSGDGVNPTYSLSGSAGVGATIELTTNSDDRHGIITLTCGTGTSAGVLATITFNQAYPGTLPVIVISNSIDNSAGIVLTNQVFTRFLGSSSFIICGTPTDSHVYIIHYIVQN